MISNEEEKEKVTITVADEDKSANLDTDYIAIIQEMKKNSVTKADYEKMVAENKKLVQALSTSKVADDEVVDEIPLKNSSDYMKQIDNAYTNLDYITAVCNFRDALLKEEGIDCFNMHKPGEGVEEDEAIAAAQTADVLKQCVEDANGDPVAFNTILQRRFVDPAGVKFKK